MLATQVSAESASPDDLLKKAQEYRSSFAPLPKSLDSKTSPNTPEKIALGQKLFFEKRLSLDNDISCNSCHNLATFGVDNKPTSPGHRGKLGDRNSPTVYNAGLHFSQFWDGRAKDLEEQAIGPILNPSEMAMPSDAEVLNRLRGVPEYVDAFAKAFPKEKSPLTYKNVGAAIAAFERQLLTPSRFDQFLNGDNQVLTPLEIQGMITFVETGCTTCHNGVAIGGNQFQKIGLIKPFPTKDFGRFNVSKKPEDMFFFKVPSLRNVAQTAPYMHDGKKKTLEEMVRIMGRHQIGLEVSDADIKLIVGFLHTLTGEIPAIAKEIPKLPGEKKVTNF